MDNKYGYVKEFSGVPVYGVDINENFELNIFRCNGKFNIELYDTIKKESHNTVAEIEDIIYLIKFLTLEIEKINHSNEN